jgi:hypothetical protein
LVKGTNSIELKGLFFSLQEQMIAKMQTSREFIPHLPTKGAAAEQNWLSMLNTYLPERYRAGPGFVVDSTGALSDQIDIVVFDRQYSPLIFSQDGVCYIPAESVYAVFDVKHEMRRASILEAAKNVQSVRRLKRTTVPIKYVAGTFRPKKLFEITAGVLCLETWWKEGLGDSLEKVLNELAPAGFLDLGCALQSGSFEAVRRGKKIKVEKSSPQAATIFFFLRLLHRLQQVGTVPAMDILRYAAALKPKKT